MNAYCRVKPLSAELILDYKPCIAAWHQKVEVREHLDPHCQKVGGSGPQDPHRIAVTVYRLHVAIYACTDASRETYVFFSTSWELASSQYNVYVVGDFDVDQLRASRLIAASELVQSGKDTSDGRDGRTVNVEVQGVQN